MSEAVPHVISPDGWTALDADARLLRPVLYRDLDGDDEVFWIEEA